MTVTIPVKTTYSGTGFQQAERDAKRLQKEQIAATRAQIAEHRKVTQLTAKLDRDLAKERKRQADLTREWATAGAVAFGILAKAGSDAVAAARESAASDRELLGVLNSTGKGAAGFREELAALATELENNSNFSDEAVQHVQGLLLTFDRVGRDVMPRATQAAADLAELMDGDLQGAAIQVGKALDGQVSALKRSGVSFTEAQEEQIKALFAAGKAAEAQNVILTQLEKQVSGQAKAARDAAGGLKDMEVAAGRLQESMGSLLLTIGDGGFSDFATGFLDKLNEGAKAWEGAIENMRILAEARERAVKAQGEQATVRRGAFGQAVGSSIEDEALAKAVAEVAAEHEAAKEAAEEHARALNENTDATEGNAASQDDLAKVLEKANQARRSATRELIDITEGAAKDTADTWDDYFKDEADAWKDHSKTVEKINADSERERVQNEKALAKSLLDIDKNLAKDLAKTDKDLARDKAKAQRDSEKQIGRMIQDAARQEKRERRQRQIDAKGDQRLFDFEMRQLAAEGEFNAILAAKERRKIEQQIEAEKTTEQQRARDEDSRIEIERARQDARDRLAEMEAEAEERKQMLLEQAEEQRAAAIEQAAEDEARRQEELAQALADEQENYQERLAALREARDEKLAEIEQTKQESIAKLAEELTETKDLTRAEMEALIPVAAKLGGDVGTAFAEGLSSGFAENQKINEMLGSASSPGAGTINPAHPTTSSNFAPKSKPNPYKSIYGFADGGMFTVGGFGGTDSQLVSFLASPGEKVTITPPGQSRSGGAASIVINQTINGGGDDLARRIAAVTQAAAEREVERFYDEILVPWSNGG